MVRRNGEIWSAAKPVETLLAKMRRTTVPKWAPVVIACFAFGYIMSPERAWAFSTAGTGLEQNSTTPEQIDLTIPVVISSGGTGQTTQTAAMDALSPTTTKGDILVDNGTNVVRLAIGSNDEVLIADSAEAAGVKWGTASGSDTTVPGKLAIRSSVKFSMGASATKYMALNGAICTTEKDCLIPFEAGVFDNVTCMSTETQGANEVTIKFGDGTCTGSPTYGTGFDLAATARTSATASESFTLTTGECAAIQITTGAGEALAESYINCSVDVTGPAA